MLHFTEEELRKIEEEGMKLSALYEEFRRANARIDEGLESEEVYTMLDRATEAVNAQQEAFAYMVMNYVEGHQHEDIE